MQPEWRKDGKELFYISPAGKLTAVPVVKISRRSPQARRTCSSTSTSQSRALPTQNLTTPSRADGQRFLVNTVVDQPTRPALTVILNWTAALKK